MNKQKITIKEVAVRAGVSIATVSRVLNGEASVDEVWRQKVEMAVQELNYIPNVNARNIRSKQTENIGVIIPNAFDNFFSKMLEGIIEEAEIQGKNVITLSCHGRVGWEWKCLQRAAKAGVNSLLYCPQGEIDAGDIYRLFDLEMPLIILYRRDILRNVPHIYHDNVKGGYIAAKYLLLQGRRRIAFIASAWGSPFADASEFIRASESSRAGAFSATDRLRGYRQALAEFNLELESELIRLSDFGYDSGYAAGKKLMAELVDFDAVIAGNDVLAAGVMRALAEQNIKIPEKVSIIGFDDSIPAQIAIPQLTSVRQQPFLIGREAMRMLADRQAGKVVQDQIIDVELIVRDSTSQKEG